MNETGIEDDLVTPLGDFGKIDLKMIPSTPYRPLEFPHLWRPWPIRSWLYRVCSPSYVQMPPMKSRSTIATLPPNSAILTAQDPCGRPQ